jgi:molecular chaperone DnaJ
LRVRGAGVAGEDDKLGDLLVIIDIAVPKNLSKKQSEALKAFADLDNDSPRAHLEASD